MPQTSAEEDASATISHWQPSDDSENMFHQNGTRPVDDGEIAKAVVDSLVASEQTQAEAIGHCKPHSTPNQCLIHNTSDQENGSIRSPAQRTSIPCKQWA
jgi:hypothetical protein